MTETGIIARWRTDDYRRNALDLPPKPWVEPNFSFALESGICLEQTSDRERTGLARLHRLGLLEWSVGTPLIARPLSRDLPLPSPTTCSDETALSEWTMLRPMDGTWVLESAASPWQVSDERGLRPEATTWSVAEWSLLAAIGMTASGDTPTLAADWNFHDLLFASRSRRDALQPLSPMNAAARPAPPLHRVPKSAANPEATRIRLPAVTGPRTNEPLLFEAMEARRTIRTFADTPLAIADLGELLWRSLRLKEQRTSKVMDGMEYESAIGPAPSGGGLHAIDTWVATPRVAGLPHAWWWYDPKTHELVMVRESMSDSTDVPALMRFTVRHARTSWKYSGFAHALELKDMGAIMLAVQLAGAPLGIGTWLLGSGSSAHFAADLGIDLATDHPLGELIIGKRKDATPGGEQR